MGNAASELKVFYLTTRTTRVVEETHKISAPDGDVAVELFHGGDGELIDECVIECLEGPDIERLVEAGEDLERVPEVALPRLPTVDQDGANHEDVQKVQG